jgi:hypothetical protein
MAQMLPNADTTLLPMIIEMISRKIDDVCQRYFGSITETRSFYLGENRNLQKSARRQITIDDFIPDDSTTVSLNGVTIDPENYWFLPLNTLPKQFFLIDGSQIDWTQFGPALIPPEQLEITGKWGYAAVPSPIKSACMLLSRIAYQGFVGRFAKSEQMGEYRVTYADIESTLDDEHVARLVGMYIRHRVL